MLYSDTIWTFFDHWTKDTEEQSGYKYINVWLVRGLLGCDAVW
jgi:hypothetical protein